SAATVTAFASSTNLVTYQWFFNSTPIAGATNSTFTIPKAQLTNAGFYSINISYFNSVTTNGPAMLDVYTGLQNTNVPAGGALILGTQAAGPLTPTYQWCFDGTNLA